MRIISIILFLAFNVTQLPAQIPSGKQQPGNSNIGVIRGKVIDSQTLQPVEFAAVSLLAKRDSALISGAITNGKGNFIINDLPFGRFFIKVNFIGYKPVIVDSVFISSKKTEISIGTIKLAPSMENLAGVEIIEEKPLIQTTTDRKIFNVGKSIITEGGSALDIMENLPSVTVDMDGNVSLRGSSNVTILIDGKPSGLTGSDRTAVLEQLQASAIERVELITNPSAKFDPDGMAGIINIVLKRSRKPGINGNISFNAGNGKKYNGSGSINYFTGKVNLFSNLSYRSHPHTGSFSSFRHNTLNDTIPYLRQESVSDDNNSSYLFRAGADYYINKKNTLSFSGTYSIRGRDDKDSIHYQDIKPDYSIDRIYVRESNSDRNNENFDLSLNYRYQFEKPKREFSFDGSYSNNYGNDESKYLTRYYLPDLSLDTISDISESDYSTDNGTILYFQIDYTSPFGKEGKVDAGIKSIFRNIDNEFNSIYYNTATDIWTDDTSGYDHFIYDEQIHAGYITYENKHKNFSYQAGIRLEQAATKSTQAITSEHFSHDYFSFFPSLHLSQKLKKNNEIQISYSRRINRPRLRTLNPFINYTDPFNLRYGNPEINPEYINSFEVQHLKIWKNNTISSSLFFRQTNDMIARYRTLDSNGVTLTTWRNLATGQSYGLDFMGNVKIFKWWNFIGSFSYFKNIINGSNVDAAINSSGYSWNTKGITTLILPKGFELQLSGNYRAPINVSSGTIGARYWCDFGLKKSVLKNKGSITLRIRDIFNTRKFNIDSESTGFTQEFTYKRESRYATIGFSYRFGKKTKSRESKREQPEERDLQMDEDVF